MSEAPVLLREGRPEDLERIREFATATFTWGDYVPDQYLTWLEDSSGAALVATDAEDQVVAVVHAQQLSPGEGWLSGARVHPDYQRQGIGSMLNGAGVEWMQAKGLLVVRLTVEENNQPAQGQVEKLGYRPIARFGLAERSFERLGRQVTRFGNGGRRLPGPDRFDLAPAAEAEPAYMVWATGDLNRAGHGLYASEGWSFRRLQLDDLEQAARQRHFWTSPSGWAVAAQGDENLWVSLFLTTPDEADWAARALVDLAEEMRAGWMGVMVPRIAWLEAALAVEHLELNYPNIVYEKPL